MNELQVFDNPEFGAIRTLDDSDGTILFYATDVANGPRILQSRRPLSPSTAGTP